VLDKGITVSGASASPWPGRQFTNHAGAAADGGCGHWQVVHRPALDTLGDSRRT
jgi:hypothetical protein